MSTFIGIEDLAANAIISLSNKTKEDKVNIEKLSSYGTKVVENLSKNGEKAVVIYNKDVTNALERNVLDDFELYIEKDKRYIKLKEKMTIKDAIKKYRACLSINTLLAFTSKEALRTLGVE